MIYKVGDYVATVKRLKEHTYKVWPRGTKGEIRVVEVSDHGVWYTITSPGGGTFHAPHEALTRLLRRSEVAR